MKDSATPEIMDRTKTATALPSPIPSKFDVFLKDSITLASNVVVSTLLHKGISLNGLQLTTEIPTKLCLLFLVSDTYIYTISRYNVMAIQLFSLIIFSYCGRIMYKLTKSKGTKLEKLSTCQNSLYNTYMQVQLTHFFRTVIFPCEKLPELV